MLWLVLTEAVPRPFAGLCSKEAEGTGRLPLGIWEAFVSLTISFIQHFPLSSDVRHIVRLQGTEGITPKLMGSVLSRKKHGLWNQIHLRHSMAASIIF